MWRGSLGVAYLFPPLSSGGASIAPPCPVSTSRSSNRTCGFPASGSPTDVAFRHTLPALPGQLHLKPKLVPESPHLLLEEVIGLRHSPDRCPLRKHIRSQAPFLRRRYPASQVLRACPPPHSARTVPHGVPVGVSPPPLGLPVLRRISLYIHAVASTPAGPLDARVAGFSNDGGLPRLSGGSAPALAFSRPAQRSLRVTACILAGSPCDPLHRRLRRFRYLRHRSGCYRLKQPLSGWEFHPLKIRAFSRRTDS